MTISDYLKRENNNLDLIRIICASMVIIGHSYELTDPGNQVDLIRWLVGFTYSGTLAVQIFFFISGMLVTNSILTKQSIVNFSISRIFRLVPALLFVLLLTTFIVGPLVTSMSWGEYFSNSATYKYVSDNLLYKDNYSLPGVFENQHAFGVNGSLWSLSYEVGCYIFLLGVFCLIRTNKLLANLLILFVIADSFFKFNLLFGWVDARNHYDSGLLRLCFSTGALLAVNKDTIKLEWKVLVGLVVLNVLFWQSGMVEAIFAITCCFFALLLSATAMAKQVKIKHDISYGIYVWGFVVQQTLYYALGPINVYLFMIYSLYIASLMGFISFLLAEERFMRYGKLFETRWRKQWVSSKFNEPLVRPEVHT